MKPPKNDDYIPLQPLANLDSLDASVTLAVNGLINNQRTQGDLNGLVTINRGSSRATVSGSLLGEIAAQIGGSLIGLFTPSTVDLYKVPQGAYIVINGLLPICVRPNAANKTAILDELSPQSLLIMLTRHDVARGRLVGQTVISGRPVDHYIIDGQGFLDAARASSDPQLRTFGQNLWTADDADLYVDAQESFPVAFRGKYSGAFEPLKFVGGFDVQITLTGVNLGTKITLPASCDEPITL